MASINVEASPAEPTSHSEFSTKEQKPDKTSDRSHVNVLLDLSEEVFMKDLEPHEYHCYHGWEEAVRGWARAAPLASILLVQKTDRKPKRKEADHDSITSVDSDQLAEQRSESHLGPPKSILSRSSLLTQQMWTCTNTDISDSTPDVPETPVLNAMSKTMAQLDLEDRTKEIRTPFQHPQASLKYNMVDNRSSKPQKNSHRTKNALIPIKNFTFLPPINMPHNRQQNCTGKKHLQGEPIMENLYIIDKISRIRGTEGEMVYSSELPRDTFSEAVSSKYRTCPHNPNFYSAVNVSVPKRYHVGVSSKPETLHPTGYTMSKNLHSDTAANRQLHMHPSCLYS